MTPAWRADVDRRLRELGWTRTDLAKKLKVAKSAVSAMLGGVQTSSALVPKTSELLGIGMPVLGTDSEIADLVGKLDGDQREALIVLLRGMLRPSDPRTDDDK